MSQRKYHNLIILIALAICMISYIYINMCLKTSSVEFYTPRTITLEKKKYDVPFIVHEYWHSRRIPKLMSNVIKRLIERNPEFDVYIYSEKEAVAFLQKHFDNDILEAYHGFKPSAFRSDLFRYCVLYIYGGIYIDTKIDFTVPLKELIVDSKLVFPKTKDKWCNGKGVTNGFIIAPPKNDILLQIIKEIVINYKQRLYKNNNLHVTGPCLIGEILDKNNESAIRDNAVCECSEENGVFIFTCNGKKVAQSYTEYRKEQNDMQKEPSYKILYQKHDIYW